jgi:hypothetical protein
MIESGWLMSCSRASEPGRCTTNGGFSFPKRGRKGAIGEMILIFLVIVCCDFPFCTETYLLFVFERTGGARTPPPLIPMSQQQVLQVVGVGSNRIMFKAFAFVLSKCV